MHGENSATPAVETNTNKYRKAALRLERLRMRSLASLLTVSALWLVASTPALAATSHRVTVDAPGNPGAAIFLPVEDEWDEGAYYDPSAASFFGDAAGTATPPACAIAPGTAANCDESRILPGSLRVVGSYTGSASSYEIFDQGGNVAEQTDPIAGPTSFGKLIHAGPGGSWLDGAPQASASTRSEVENEDGWPGIRVASFPELGTSLLVMTGLLGLVRSRRR